MRQKRLKMRNYLWLAKLSVAVSQKIVDNCGVSSLAAEECMCPGHVQVGFAGRYRQLITGSARRGELRRRNIR